MKHLALPALRRWYHLALVAIIGVGLCVLSFPDDDRISLVFVAAVVRAVLLWVPWTLVYVLGRQPGRSDGSAWWRRVMPLLLAATVTLVVTDAPLMLRFVLGRSDFDSFVRSHAAPPTAKSATSSGMLHFEHLTGPWYAWD